MKSLVMMLVSVALCSACGKDDPVVGNSPSDAGDDMGAAPSDAATQNGDATATSDGAVTDDAGNTPLPDGSTPTGAVQTTSGPVAGVSADGVVSYKGIPYAEPPVGLNRFRPPRPHAVWTNTLDATSFGSPCPQRNASSGTNFGDEDCLFLNIWAPEGAANLPVMFFIHGGGFTQGESSGPLYNGENLAGRDVVVVTINYRIGALGFLATDELASESGDDTAGNYGLKDQALAMQWVQDNIGSFGGDPAKVTIFGESAGGVSVCAHLGAESSESLFAQAIIESGSGCDNFVHLRTGTLITDPAVMIGAQYVAAAGCAASADVVQCLRDLDASDIVDAMYDLTQTGLGLPPFGPNIDGVFLTEDPSDSFRNGTARDVPLITGSNADEATVFTATTPVPTVAAYEAYVTATFGPLANQVLAIYPASDFARPKDAYNALYSDVAFICPALRFAGLAAAGEPAWTYHFTRVVPGGALLGAFHGLELVYVFGTFESAPAYTPNADDFALSDAMMDAWTGFAKTGEASWQAYDRLSPAIRLFDTTVQTTPEIREGRCIELISLGIIP